MKFRFILIFTIFSINLFAQKTGSYFYLDTGCQNCSIENVNSAENYWVITDGVFHVDKKLTFKEEAQIINEFKLLLYREYSFPLPLTHSLCIRYDNSLDAIHKNRASKIEKMSNRGYEIRTLKLDLPTELSHPSLESYLGNLENVGFSGAVLVAEKGEVIHKGFYGWSDHSKRIKISEHTLFPSASIAKAFTAQEILLLNKSNLLDLNSSISTYFEGVPADKKNITIHQLLSHTSGLRRNLLNDGDSVHSEAVSKLLNKPLSSEPGVTFKYSNAGYQLLALLIEQVTKDSYQANVREQILTVSGMTSAGFLNSNFETYNLPLGYSEYASVSFPIVKTSNYANIGSRGIVGTLDDYHRWISRLIDQKDDFAKLTNPSVATEGEEESYGYGFYIYENNNLAITDGDIYGYYSLISYDKIRDRTIIIFTNRSLYGFGVHKKTIHKNIRAILDEGKNIELHTSDNYNSKPIKHCQGEYVYQEGRLIVTALNGESKICAMGQAGINDLMNIDNSQKKIVASKSNQIDSLFSQITMNDYKKAQTFLPVKYRDFFINSIREEIDEYLTIYGKLNGYEIGGTLPLPWQSPNYETVAYLHFEQKIVDMTFVWNDDDLYETLTEVERIYPLVLTIAPIDRNRFTYYDMLKDKGEIIQFTALEGKSINQIELSQNKKYLKIERNDQQ